MESFIIETDASYAGDNGQKLVAETEAFDDKAIMDLAKRRLSAKQNLIGQVVDFFLISLCMFILMCTDDTESRFIVALVFCSYWGIRLLMRIFKFVKPSFKDGVTAYFRERKERKIESEYIRLRKMKRESVYSELSE